MTELFNNGAYLVIMGIVIAIIGGWVAIQDYRSRKKEHRSRSHKHEIEMK